MNYEVSLVLYEFVQTQLSEKLEDKTLHESGRRKN